MAFGGRFEYKLFDYSLQVLWLETSLCCGEWAKEPIFQILLRKTCGLSLTCRLSRACFVLSLDKYLEMLWGQMQSGIKQFRAVKTEELELRKISLYLTNTLFFSTGSYWEVTTDSTLEINISVYTQYFCEAVWTSLLLLRASRKRLLLFCWSP